MEKSLLTHDGELLQYFGDGSLSIFRSSVRAVEAAVAIQRDLQGEPPLRIGLHAGEIAYDEQGAYGPAVNIAARLEPLSVAGGILVSEKIFDDICRHPELTTVPSGSVRLKNVSEAVRTFALSVEGVVVPTDPIDSGAEQASQLPAELRERLDDRSRRPVYATASTGTVPGRVPLVGRSREVEILGRLVEQTEERNGSTVFLRGPRGAGKTRLAREAAEYARSRGWTVLSGRAYPAERLRAVRALLGRLPADPAGTVGRLPARVRGRRGRYFARALPRPRSATPGEVRAPRRSE